MYFKEFIKEMYAEIHRGNYIGIKLDIAKALAYI